MAASKIVLFDIPSKEPIHAWSLNTWRTRLVLNYKGLDYETEWLEYPEIRPRLQPHFPDKNKDDLTVPTVIMPDGTYIMDSLAIAQELEKQHPSPSLHLDSPLPKKYTEHLKPAFNEALIPVFVLGVPNRLLKEVNHAYWHESRSAWCGMPLEQFVQENSAEKAYEAAAPHLRNITAMLKENDKGPFFMGDTISYVDFIHAGFLVMFRRLGDDIFQPLLEATGDPELHLKFLEALKPWIKRDDH
ncbi:putative glutathione S-transferase [Xylaria sp. FL1777]|nr:putative glutathione S-transferase [Xylaria sp. FL1777]